MEKIKVAVIFGMKPNFEKDAFEYFLLNVNKIQSIYEFTFPDLCDRKGESIYPTFIYEKKRVKFNESIVQVDSFIKSNNIHVAHCISIITHSFENNYFFNAGTDVSVITTDIWEKSFAPPTLFEYLLHSIFTCLMYSKILPNNAKLSKEQSSINLRYHSDMRGCLADLTRQKYQDRIAITLGYICNDHTQKILNVYGKDYLEQLQKVINREWIGDIKENGSVAYNLKHIFKFDINRDSGFNKTLWEKVENKFYELPGTLTGEIFKIIITVILTYFLIKWGLIDKK